MAKQKSGKTAPVTPPASSEIDLDSSSNDQSTISSSDRVSQVGNMWLRNDIKNVNKGIEFLKSYTLEKNNNNGSQTTTRQNTNKKSRVKNFDEKVIEYLQTLSCITSKILSKIDKLTEKHEHCGDNTAQTIFVGVTRPKNSSIIIPNKATVKKLEVKIDQVEQHALSKTIMVKCVSETICKI